MFGRNLIRVFVIVLLSLSCRSNGQEFQSILRGSVSSLVEPIPNATVEVRARNGQSIPEFSKTGVDGAFQLHLQPGTYELKIWATGFYTAHVRDVAVLPQSATTLPEVRLMVGAVADCGLSPHPDYYRPLGETKLGAVAGIVKDQKGKPISGATVKLFAAGEPMAVTKTRDDGAFAFRDVDPSEKKWQIAVERNGYFEEEVTGLTTLPGFESVGTPVVLESCKPGRCQPNLKTIHVIGPCA